MSQIQEYLHGLGLFQQILIILLLSMIPVIERGAIPMAVVVGIPWYIALPVAFTGNFLPAPFVLLFIKKYLNGSAGILYLKSL